jgi:single-stranded-DNA-specific exonuclease
MSFPLSSGPTTWVERLPGVDPAGLALALGVSPLLAGHLARRGIDNAEEGGRFLSPRLQDMADPAGMAGMAPAVERLARAVSRREKVALYGDYDVDGITSTSLVALVLRELGLEPILHIPHRVRDGYGLNRSAVEALVGQGASLLVALDCGVTAVEEVRAAVALGTAVIVVDHHTVPAELPPAVAVLNPHRPDCPFREKGLCAVGIAFFLCVALRAALRGAGLLPPRGGPDLRDHLDLVALGTVADMVPLTGQNRILVAQGLKVLAAARRPGVRALMAVSRVDPARVTAGDVGFQLAPRINAAGRLADAMLGVRLLTTRCPEEAGGLAAQLDAENRARREQEQRAVAQATRMALEEPVHRDARALVLHSPDWHPGVVGIAAQKLVERFHRPTILVGAGGVGSGRSIESFHLHNALCCTAEHLRGFGGHAHAAGLRLDPERLPAFRAAFYDHAREHLTPEDLVGKSSHDGALPLGELRDELVEALQRAAPFGRGNQEPCFLWPGVQVASRRVVGDGPLQVELGGAVKGIAFRLADRAAMLAGPVDFLGTPEHDHYRGVKRLNLRIRDIRPAQGDT